MSTGDPVGGHLKGHTNTVNSVTFSPDGKWIVSGSSDKTIRVWDAMTHDAVGDPLEGHSSLVTSVAFSPDGTRIVSGSYDKTIRVWDAATHAAVGDPLEGHTHWVLSVAFSPDGMRIVSGSCDNSVRVWDAPFVQPVPTKKVDGPEMTLRSYTSNSPPTSQSGSDQHPGEFNFVIFQHRVFHLTDKFHSLHSDFTSPGTRNTQRWPL